jgi:hypothetical protein
LVASLSPRSIAQRRRAGFAVDRLAVSGADVVEIGDSEC